MRNIIGVGMLLLPVGLIMELVSLGAIASIFFGCHPSFSLVLLCPVGCVVVVAGFMCAWISTEEGEE